MSAAAAPPALIELRGVERRFGATRALDGLSLRVAAGERIALVGRNGAGKSTLLRVLLGYVDVDRGEVVRTAGLRVGYLPEHVALPAQVEVEEWLVARARLQGVARAARPAAIARALELAGLEAVRRRALGALSKGFRQRVGLAGALIASPALLVLDEPTAGLDPPQIAELAERLGRLPASTALVVSTHAVGELEAIFTRVVVVASGALAADATPAALQTATGATSLHGAVVATLRAPAGEVSA